MIGQSNSINRRNARPKEQEVLDSLLSVHPNFGGDRIAWTPCAPDPPDFIGTDADGARIGLELTEWLDSEQSRKCFTRQDNEGYLTLAIASDTHPKPKRFKLVQLNLKESARVRQADAAQFSGEFYKLIYALDAKPSQQLNKPYHVIPPSDFKAYRALTKYLASLYLFPTEGMPMAQHWVVFQFDFCPMLLNLH